MEGQHGHHSHYYAPPTFPARSRRAMEATAANREMSRALLVAQSMVEAQAATLHYMDQDWSNMQRSYSHVMMELGGSRRREEAARVEMVKYMEGALGRRQELEVAREECKHLRELAGKRERELEEAQGEVKRWKETAEEKEKLRNEAAVKVGHWGFSHKQVLDELKRVERQFARQTDRLKEAEEGIGEKDELIEQQTKRIEELTTQKERLGCEEAVIEIEVERLENQVEHLRAQLPANALVIEEEEREVPIEEEEEEEEMPIEEEDEEVPVEEEEPLEGRVYDD